MIEINEEEQKSCPAEKNKETEHRMPNEERLLQKGIFIGCLLLSVGYSVPLILLQPSSWNTADSQTSQEYILKYSVLCSTDNHALIAYFSTLSIAISLVLYLLLRMNFQKVQQIQAQSQDSLQKFVVFLRLPHNQMHHADIEHALRKWWQESCLSDGQQLLESSQQTNTQNCENFFRTHVFEKVLMSYNHPAYLQLRQKIEQQQSQLHNFSSQNHTVTFARWRKTIEDQKRNFLQAIPADQYCLIIFKKPKFATYFKNSQKLVLLEGEQVTKLGAVEPWQIAWNSLHLCSNQNECSSWVSFIFLTVLILLGLGIQVMLFWINSECQENQFWQQYFVWIIASIINLYLFLGYLLIIKITRLRSYVFFHQKFTDISIKYLLFSSLTILVCPTLACLLIDYNQVGRRGGGAIVTVCSFLIYSAITLLYRCIMCLCCLHVQNTDQTTSVPENLDHSNLYFPTVWLISLFLSPIFPAVFMVSLTWTGLWLTLHLIADRCSSQSHYQLTTKLESLLLCMFRASILSLALGLLYLFLIYYFYHQHSISIPCLVLSCCLFVIVALSLCGCSCLQNVYQSLYKCYSSNKFISQQSKQPLEYCQACQRLNDDYERYNAPYVYAHQAQSFEDQAVFKVNSEMNTMSRTLLQSLRERLMASRSVVLPASKQPLSEQQKLNSMRFEYEKKIAMTPYTPKVTVPLLFKKQQRFIGSRHESEQNSRQMDDYDSIFSSDDEMARKALKQYVKQSIKKINF